MKFRVKPINKKIKGGYIGMNYEAAKKLHIPFNEGYNTILIYKKLPRKARLSTIQHEKIEEHLIRFKNYSYPKAHKRALAFERFHSKFIPNRRN